MAVIVQDLGAAHLLQETLPQLPLHASTQMAVHNTPGVQFLEQQGFAAGGAGQGDLAGKHPEHQS